MTIHRRQLLRGLAGGALGLPLLEAMFDGRRAYAQVARPPTRYVLVYCGQSLESEDSQHDGPGDNLVPDAPGALAAPLKLALRPLESLKSQLSVVSGLEIPVQEGGNVPPGSRIRGGFHYTTTGPLVSGTHNTSEFDSQALSESSDVIMTRTLSAGTRVPHLVYRAQALEYKDYNVDAVSWNAPTTRNGWTTPHPIEPVASPRLAYDSLFSTFTPPGAPDPSIARGVARRRAVTELVRREAETLAPQLGVADRLRLEGHLEGVRALEARIAALESQATPMTQACRQPTRPGTDPAANADASYSDEDSRAYAFEDMIHMALACDLSRVVSYQITCSMPGMTLPPGLAIDQAGTPLRYTDWHGEAFDQPPSDLHNVSHNYSSRTLAQTISWHTKHLANLLQKLRDTPEATGTLLDHTVVVFLMEGGAGPAAPHTSERMAALVCGGSSLGLRLGQHVVTARAHPASVLLTAMQAAGSPASALGEITSGLPQLRV